MPELAEVEVIRRGLQRLVVGRVMSGVEVHHPRAIRRHLPGPLDFTGRLIGAEVLAARRRGKFLWLPLDDGAALLAHLGMSGQLLVEPPDAPAEPHLRVRIGFADLGPQLRFVDQRTFGGLWLASPDEVRDGLPLSIAHIALDPLDPDFDDDAFTVKLRARRTGVKRALLDQTLVSGIGNIYADEALWRARLHWSRPTRTLSRPAVAALLAGAREVLTAALVAGGTSFDALYVDTDGRGGYFERSLAVYGRGGQPCVRCGTPIRRDPFMNRSSFWCPRCQPRPRRPHP